MACWVILHIEQVPCSIRSVYFFFGSMDMIRRAEMARMTTEQTSIIMLAARKFIYNPWWCKLWVEWFHTGNFVFTVIHNCHLGNLWLISVGLLFGVSPSIIIYYLSWSRVLRMICWIDWRFLYWRKFLWPKISSASPSIWRRQVYFHFLCSKAFKISSIIKINLRCNTAEILDVRYPYDHQNNV